MNILYITPFPLDNSSSGSYVMEMAEYFSSHGNNVLVVNIDNEKINYEKRYKVITVPFNDNNVNFQFPCLTNHPHTSMNFSKLTEEQLDEYKKYLSFIFNKVIEYFKPDLIHSQYLWVNTSVLFDITKLPIITTSFGSEISAMKEDMRYRIFVENSVKESKYLIAPSKQIETLLKNEFFLDRAQLRLIYRGYDDEVYKFIEDKQEMYRSYFSIKDKCKKMVMYSNNLTPLKGIDVFLNSASNILSKREDVCFLCEGKGDYEVEVFNFAKKFSENFIYFPEITEQERALLFHISHLTVIPIKMPQFNLNVLESLAMGTPVLSSKYGDLEYLINSENGRLIEELDNETVEKNILDMIDNGFKEKTSFFCHQFAERNYSKSSSFKVIKRLYDEILSEK